MLFSQQNKSRTNSSLDRIATSGEVTREDRESRTQKLREGLGYFIASYPGWLRRKTPPPPHKNPYCFLGNES